MIFKAKQKGFTLLELLVVITLLAILSVGALIAYEGLGDTAQATAASKNIAQTDQAIRNYRAVTQNYPNQFDNLVVSSSGAAAGLVPEFAQSLAPWLAAIQVAVPTGPEDGQARLVKAFYRVGITDLQSRTVSGTTTGVEPNLQHNEGAVNLVSPGDVTEDWILEPADEDQPLVVDASATVATTHLAILPTWNGDTNAACVITDFTVPANKLNGTAIGNNDALRLNRIHDNLEDDQCNLVVALGFGHDAAHATNGSSVAIATAPTFISANVNPSENYARYVALFHVGQDADEDGTIAPAEIFNKARLLAVADTEGNVIDQTIADATAENAN